MHKCIPFAEDLLEKSYKSFTTAILKALRKFKRIKVNLLIESLLNQLIFHLTYMNNMFFKVF